MQQYNKAQLNALNSQYLFKIQLIFLNYPLYFSLYIYNFKRNFFINYAPLSFNSGSATKTKPIRIVVLYSDRYIIIFQLVFTDSYDETIGYFNVYLVIYYLKTITLKP